MIEENICVNCGSNKFIIKDGYKICKYCSSKYLLKTNKKGNMEDGISLQSDIDILLQKCKDEPWNSKKYASLILDIDPTNREAKSYLR